MADEIEQWAKKRVCDLFNEEGCRNPQISVLQWQNAFARYIMEHEEPPVDPLLIEAREICASRDGVDALQAQSYRDGRYDTGGAVATALAALRRGIELGKAGEA